jgi:hypothetical protein
MHSKSTSTIESLRKPISRIVAAAFVLAAVVTVPRAFGSVSGELLELLGYCLLTQVSYGEAVALDVAGIGFKRHYKAVASSFFRSG